MPITDPKIIARAGELFLARTYLEEEPATRPVLSFFDLYHYVMDDNPGDLTHDQHRELFANSQLKRDYQKLLKQKHDFSSGAVIGFAPQAAAAATGTGHQKEPKIIIEDADGQLFATIQLADPGDGRRIIVYIQFEKKPWNYKTISFKSNGIEVPPRPLKEYELPDQNGRSKLTLGLRNEEDKRLIDLLQNEGIQMGADIE